MSFANLRISSKFPLVIVAVSLLTGLATGITAQTKFSTQLDLFAKDQLVALRESRQATLETYLNSIRQDLELLATNKLVGDALVDFITAWYAETGTKLGDDPGITLQRLYIHDNPYPEGRKSALIDAGDGSEYSAHHGDYHLWLLKYLRKRGYDDLFLFAPDGNLVYSVVKELDYATNFYIGEWSDTDLGEAFRAASDNPSPGFQVFFDFQGYGPSNGKPANFVAMPVFNQIGAFIGVVALQMPVGRINDMMQVATGLGETGEAYIVGEDFLMRSDSRFSETSTILNRLVYTATSQKALAGESGIEVLEDARGGAVVSAYAPIEFMGARWAILAEISQAELLAPIAETGTFMIVAVAGILLLVTAVGIALARGLSRPIVEMTGNMRRLAAGDLDVEIGSTDRTDEIGEMAAALDVFKENAVRRQKAEASLKESGALFEQAGRMASLGHWAYDEIEERVTHCSEETARIHGLTVDEYKNSFSHGDTELMLVHPDDRQELGDIVENAYGDGKGYDTEYRIVRPDGAVRHVREVGEPVLDDSGTLVRTIGMVQDITERKETEDALRESQSLYLQAGRMAQFGHWIYDSAADRLVFCSEEVARMHGVSVDEIKSIIDSTEGSIGRVHPDDQEDYARAMRESEDRIEPYDLEIKIVRPDGAVRYLREMGEPVVDDNGSVVRYYGTIQDITERKNSEEELARKEAQLRIALDNMPGGILMIDEDNKIVVFNDQIRELFDLPEGVLVVGGPVETSVRYQAERGDFGEGDVDDLVEQVRAGFSSGEPTKYERRLFTGRVVEISVAVSVRSGRGISAGVSIRPGRF